MRHHRRVVVVAVAVVISGLVPNTPVTLQAELGGRWSEAVTVEIGTGTMQTGIVLRMGS